MVEYFRNKYGWNHWRRVQLAGFDLCYQIHTIYTVPTIYDEADLELEKRTMFLNFEEHNELCTTVLSIVADGPNVLGAAQQANYRFLFDAGASTL